jgi:succinoglycan biosynthesis transport protein ExoP
VTGQRFDPTVLGEEWTSWVRRDFSTLLRRRWLVLTCVALGLAGAAVSTSLTVPMYSATAKVLLQGWSQYQVPGMQDQRAAAMSPALQGLLRGRDLHIGVAERLKHDGVAEHITTVSLRKMFRARLLGSALPTSSRTVPADELLARTRIELKPDEPGLASISFDSQDAVFSATVATTVAEVFVEKALEFRKGTATEAGGWLNTRLKEQKDKIEEVARKMEAYQERNRDANVDGRRAMLQQQLESLNSALVTARFDREAQMARNERAKDLPIEQLLKLPGIVDNAAVQSAAATAIAARNRREGMEASFGEKHPEMVAAVLAEQQAQKDLEAIANAVRGGLQYSYERALQHERELQVRLADTERQLNDAGRKGLEWELLKGDLAGNQELFKALLWQTKTANLEGEIDQGTVRIVDRPGPVGAKVGPDTRGRYSVGLGLGLVAGVALALLLESLDWTVKTPEDLKELTAAPFFGFVPHAAMPFRGTAALLDPPPMIADAFRLVRTNLVHASGNTGGGRLLLVTSPAPGDGKSTTAAYLATSLARAGARVLVIDADLHRPTVAALFNLAPEPGFSNALQDPACVPQAARPTDVPGLFVMPHGRVSPGAAEMLSGLATRDVLLRLRSQYDWVILDAPPVMPIADVAILSPMADGVLFVVAAESTTRPRLQRSLDQLAMSGGRVIGIVLNRMNVQRHGLYGDYGDTYRHYYSSAVVTEPARAPEPGGDAGERPPS